MRQIHSEHRNALDENPNTSSGRLISGPTGQRQGTCWRLLGCLLLLASVADLRAAVIVLQPHDPARSGAFSNLGSSNQQMADNFSLSQVTAIDSISWTGRYDGPLIAPANPVAFTVRVFADAGGRPAVFPLSVFNVMVNATNTGFTFGGSAWFSYSTPAPAVLTPGTYWLSVVETDPRTPSFGGSQWLWGHTSTDGARAFRLADGASWSADPFGPNHAFAINDASIPPPVPGAPGPPSNLSAVVSGANVTLNWNAPTTGGPVVSYVLEAGLSPGAANLALFNTGSLATSFVASAVPAGTYFIRVRASNSAGVSGASNEVQAVVGAVPTPCVTPPLPPVGVSATVNGSTVTLTWTAPSGPVTTYIVGAGSGSGASDIVSFVTGNALTSLTAVASPGSYFVRVQARNACGTSGDSNEVIVTVF
ncbi:MAG: fibronectin type III domain-containing protein [Acidobacteriota bacterium]